MKSTFFIVLIALAAVSAFKVKQNKVHPNGGIRVSKATCGDTYTTGLKGNFQSPNYPLPYNPDESCGWFLTAENGGKIAVVVHDLETEEGYDYLTIRDGFSSTSPLLLELSGSASNVGVLSTGPKVFVGFFPDFSNQLKGFNASWSADLPVNVELIDLL